MKHALRRIDLPGFDGSDPMGWIARAEQYFEINATPPQNKVQIACICLEGSAIHWYRWIKKKISVLTWERLIEELLKRYSGRKAMNPFE